MDGNGGLHHAVRVAGMDDRFPTLPRRMESLLLLSDSIGSSNSSGDGSAFYRVHGPSKRDDEIHQDALVHCADMGMVVAASLDDDDGHTAVASSLRMDSKALPHRVAWTPNENDTVVIVPSSHGIGGEKGHPPASPVRGAHLLECSKDRMTVAFTALGGLTAAVRFEVLGDDDSQVSSAKQLWSAEEALGSISSAIFLDETHAIAPLNGNLDADDEEEKALVNLRFSNRIQSQLQSFKSFVFGGGALSSLASLALLSDEKKVERAAAFGFAKICPMLIP